MDDDLHERLRAAGTRRAEAEANLRLAAIEMRDSKLAAQAVVREALDAKIPKTKLLEPLRLKSRQSIYNLLAWSPSGPDRNGA